MYDPNYLLLLLIMHRIAQALVVVVDGCMHVNLVRFDCDHHVEHVAVSLFPFKKGGVRRRTRGLVRDPPRLL